MDDTWTDDTPLSRTRDVVPPTEIELETGHDVLQAAIDAQKQGRRVSELWDALLAVCRLNDIAVNRLVRDHSDTIAQAYPKLDLYDYRDFIQIKLKEHEYLLHALYDGGCFTNRKLDLETYVYAFLNPPNSKTCVKGRCLRTKSVWWACLPLQRFWEIRD